MDFAFRSYGWSVPFLLLERRLFHIGRRNLARHGGSTYVKEARVVTDILGALHLGDAVAALVQPWGAGLWE